MYNIEPRQEASQSESTTDDGDRVTESEWHGFKLVGDNIDKTVKPRDMRFNHQVQSLHYFHVYAVKDRINFSGLSNNSTFIDPKSIDCNLFYPSTDDDAALAFNMEILVARILTQNIHGLSHLKYAVMPHIQHKYTANMVQKSQVHGKCVLEAYICMYCYYEI
jgi:L1 cell adhesion molecule like protein